MPLHIEGRSFLINTFPCASLGDVGFHGMQDLPFWVIVLQCVEAFSLAQPGEEQNRKGHGPQSGQYLHNWGGVVIDGIRAMP